MVRWMLLVAVLLPVGCGTLGVGRATTEDGAMDAARMEECRYYDDAYLAWKAVGFVGTALAGAGGAGGALVDGLMDDPEAWTLGLTITGAAGAVIGGLGAYMSSEYAERHAARCLFLIVPTEVEPEVEVDEPGPPVAPTPEPEPEPVADAPLPSEEPVSATKADGASTVAPPTPPSEPVPAEVASEAATSVVVP